MIELREWQKDAFEYWKKNNNRGIISVVTGGGKTIFAIHLLNYIYEIHKNYVKFLVIVPTAQLRDQWTIQIENYTDLTVENKLNKNADVCVCTNIYAQKNIDLIDCKNTMIILDECHRYGTENNASFLRLDYLATIGLTATLERLYDDGVIEILKPYIGDLIYQYNLQQAVEDKVVVPFICHNIRIPLIEQDEVKITKISRSISIAYEKNDLEKVKQLLLIRKKVHNNTPYRSAVAIKLVLDNLLQKKIVFCEEIKQADFIHDYLKEKHDLDTAIYHSGINAPKRLSQLKGFVQNRYHTLITVKGLDEGFDAPDISLAIIVSATNTNRQRIQRLGRTLRLFPNKEFAIIYTLYTSETEKQILVNNDIKNDDEKYKTQWEQYNFK